MIQHAILPIGMLSEEARNKQIRKYSEGHARKTAWQDNLRDIFKMLLLSSDPLISHNSPFLRKNKESLPLEVSDLV